MTRKEQIEQAATESCQHLPEFKIYFEMGAEWADKNPHWISVEDELPEHNEEDNGLISYPTVLVCLYDGFRTEDNYDDISGEWRDYDGDVEYWMPMPQPPRKEVNNEKDNVQ